MSASALIDKRGRLYAHVKYKFAHVKLRNKTNKNKLNNKKRGNIKKKRKKEQTNEKIGSIIR